MLLYVCLFVSLFVVSVGNGRVARDDTETEERSDYIIVLHSSSVTRGATCTAQEDCPSPASTAQQERGREREKEKRERENYVSLPLLCIRRKPTNNPAYVSIFLLCTGGGREWGGVRGGEWTQVCPAAATEEGSARRLLSGL